MRAQTKPWFMILTDIITGSVMKIGILVVLVSILYLMFVFFGDTVRSYGKLSEFDQNYFVNSVFLVARVFTVATVVVVLALITAYFCEEVLGQWLSFTGAVFYFGVPLLLIMLTGEAIVNSNDLLVMIVNQMRDIGLILLVPGVILLIRDMCSQVSNIITGKRLKADFQNQFKTGDQKKEDIKGSCGFKILPSCWDMEFCKDNLRKVCEANKQRKSCWRVKSGCYCDENLIMRNIIGADIQSDYTKRTIEKLDTSKRSNPIQDKKLKIARCQQCQIFVEHQRKKYKLMVPFVFPVVGGVLYLSYNTITSSIYSVIMNTNKFVSFVSQGKPEPSSLTGEWKIISILFVIWLAIMLVSYALKFVEYLVFKLQV